MPDEQPGDVLDYLAAIPISNAREIGLKAVACGVLILAINGFMLFYRHRYYPVTVPFAFPALLAGLCLLIIGQPRSDTGTPALWGRILLVTSATIGTGVGLGVTFLLLDYPWKN